MPVEPCNCSVAVVGVLVPSYVGACGPQHGNSLFEWVNAVVVAFVYYGMVGTMRMHLLPVGGRSYLCVRTMNH